MSLTDDDRRNFNLVAEYVRRIMTEIHAMAFFSAKHGACAADLSKVSQRACAVLDHFENVVDRLDKNNPATHHTGAILTSYGEPSIREGEHEAPSPYDRPSHSADIGK